MVDDWVYDSNSFRSGLVLGRVLAGWRQVDYGFRVVNYYPDKFRAPIRVVGLGENDVVKMGKIGTIYYDSVQMLNIPSQKKKLTYNRHKQKPEFFWYDKETMEISGETEGTNAGTYTVTFTLKDTEHYKWADDTITPKTVNWYISKARLKKPYIIVRRHKYDKTKKVASLYGFNESLMEKSGIYEATDVGKYVVTVTLKDPDNYEWAD